VDVAPVFLGSVFTAGSGCGWLREGKGGFRDSRGRCGAAAAAARADGGRRWLGAIAGSTCGSECRPARRGEEPQPPPGQQVLMARYRTARLLDQPAEFVDLAEDGLDAAGACRVRRHHPALDGGEPAAGIRRYRQVGGAAGRSAIWPPTSEESRSRIDTAL
jgi:hypothetical protein